MKKKRERSVLFGRGERKGGEGISLKSKKGRGKKGLSKI